MTSVTLQLASQIALVPDASGGTDEYNDGEMRCGVVYDGFITEVAFGMSFTLPIDFAGCTINSATLNLRGNTINNGRHLRGRIGMPNNANTLASQSVVDVVLRTPVKTVNADNPAYNHFGAADYEWSDTAINRAIDAKPMLQAAQSASALAGGFAVILMQVDGSYVDVGDETYMAVDGIDETNPPTLVIDYTPGAESPPTLGITLESTTALTSGTVAGTVSRGESRASSLVVDLVSSNTSAVTVPATVTIPASGTADSIGFTATAVGIGASVITASFDGSTSVQVTLTVIDPTAADEGDIVFTSAGLKWLFDNQGLRAATIADRIYLRPYTNDVTPHDGAILGDLVVPSFANTNLLTRLAGSSPPNHYSTLDGEGDALFTFAAITFTNDTESPVTVKGYGVLWDDGTTQVLLWVRRFPEAKPLNPSSTLQIVPSVAARNPITA